MKWFALLLLTTFIFSTAQARIEVAFLQVRSRVDGQPLVLTKGSPFAHVAIRYRGGWLHAHPYRNVEWTKRLEDFGDVAEILYDDKLPDLRPEDVAPLLGLRYDSKFNWDDNSSRYCAELVAKLLETPTHPMSFDAEIWSRISDLPRGKPGSSPGLLHEQLKSRGFRSETSNSCATFFE